MDRRRKQLRVAKQKQRLKDRQAGFGLYQIKLPLPFLDRLKTGMHSDAFVQRLCEFLNHEMVRISAHPNLALLCWNRASGYVPREEAFRLYESNWRHVDEEAMPEQERALIDALKKDFGEGVVNA